MEINGKTTTGFQRDSNWDSNGEFPLSLRTVRRGTEPNAVGVGFCERGVDAVEAVINCLGDQTL